MVCKVSAPCSGAGHYNYTQLRYCITQVLTVKLIRNILSYITIVIKIAKHEYYECAASLTNLFYQVKGNVTYLCYSYFTVNVIKVLYGNMIRTCLNYITYNILFCIICCVTSWYYVSMQVQPLCRQY